MVILFGCEMNIHPHGGRRQRPNPPVRRYNRILNVAFPLPGQVLPLLTFIWLSSLVQLSVAGGSMYASSLVCDAATTDGSSRSLTPIVSKGQLAQYRHEGFIVMKGLLDEVLIEKMARSGQIIADRAARYPQFFSVVENGLIFDGGGMASEVQSSSSTAPGTPSRNEDDAPRPDAADDGGVDAAAVFRGAAIHSKIPQIAAELMELDPETQNLRILR
jgi:hypothetical protein